MRAHIIILIAIFTFTQFAISQGTFQDLDFEEATFVLVPSGQGYNPTDEFPGWQVSIGSTPAQFVYLNGASAGGALISIDSINPIQGNYSAALFGGGVLPNSLEPGSISQTATVPAGTKSIELDANVYGPQFAVTLGGEPVNMVPLDSFVHYTLWGGNIPPVMAGQIETLSISEPPPAGTPPSELQLDDIMFSPTAVTTPEPDALTLMSLGGLLFGLYRRFQSTRK